MVEALISKTMAWEKERGTPFFYDGVSASDPIKDCCKRSVAMFPYRTWSFIQYCIGFGLTFSLLLILVPILYIFIPNC